jgi:Class II flagellar assembly regulator
MQGSRNKEPGGMAAINGIGGAAPARPARAVDGRGKKPGFRVDAPVGATEAAELRGVGGVALDGLLSLQESGTETVRDRAARRQGQAALNLLAKLQCAALAGDVAGGGADGTMDKLAALMAAPPGADDPHLTASLRAVAVRVAVELARRGR